MGTPCRTRQAHAGECVTPLRGGARPERSPVIGARVLPAASKSAPYGDGAAPLDPDRSRLHIRAVEKREPAPGHCNTSGARTPLRKDVSFSIVRVDGKSPEAPSRKALSPWW